MKLLHAVSIFLLTFISLLHAKHPNFAEKLSREEAQAEIQFVSGVIDTHYSPIFFDISPEAYDSITKEFLATPLPDSILSIDLYKIIRSYIKKFNNGHCTVYMPAKKTKKYPRTLPLRLEFRDSTIIVIGSRKNSPVPMGSKIISIDSLTSDEILARSTESGFGDTREITTIFGAKKVLNEYIESITGRNKFTIECIAPHDTTVSEATVFPHKFVFPRMSKWKDNFSFDIDTINHVGKLNITSFMWHSNPKNMKFAYSKIADFLDKSKDCSTIVFDLRNNLGGNTSTYLPLIYSIIDTPKCTLQYKSAITKERKALIEQNELYKKEFQEALTHGTIVNDTFVNLKLHGSMKSEYLDSNAFKNKKIVCFVNRSSYSSAVVFAYLLQQNGAAIIIGEQTSQPLPCHANPRSFTLSKSGMNLSIPTGTITFTGLDDSKKHFLIPDYPVREAYEDVIAQRDIFMEKVVQLQ